MVEEVGIPGENHRPPQVTDKLYHIMLCWVDLAMSMIWTQNVSYIDSCYSNYGTITTTKALRNERNKKKQKDKYKEKTSDEKLGQLELCQKERLPVVILP
jgi:hypothetical protein